MLSLRILTDLSSTQIDGRRDIRAAVDELAHRLPEPLVTNDPADPARQAETADSISMAMLLVLESLSPEERAAFLLQRARYGVAKVSHNMARKRCPTSRFTSCSHSTIACDRGMNR